MCSRTIRLQGFLINNISRKKQPMSQIFGIEIVAKEIYHVKTTTAGWM